MAQLTGNNMIELNIPTMVAAVEFYLNAEVFQETIEVKDVRKLPSGSYAIRFQDPS